MCLFVCAKLVNRASLRGFLRAEPPASVGKRLSVEEFVILLKAGGIANRSIRSSLRINYGGIYGSLAYRRCHDRWYSSSPDNGAMVSHRFGDAMGRVTLLVTLHSFPPSILGKQNAESSKWAEEIELGHKQVNLREDIKKSRLDILAASPPLVLKLEAARALLRRVSDDRRGIEGHHPQER